MLRHRRHQNRLRKLQQRLRKTTDDRGRPFRQKRVLLHEFGRQIRLAPCDPFRLLHDQTRPNLWVRLHFPISKLGHQVIKCDRSEALRCVESVPPALNSRFHPFDVKRNHRTIKCRQQPPNRPRKPLPISPPPHRLLERQPPNRLRQQLREHVPRQPPLDMLRHPNVLLVPPCRRHINALPSAKSEQSGRRLPFCVKRRLQRRSPHFLLRVGLSVRQTRDRNDEPPRRPQRLPRTL